jgi:hypothetical protein
VTLQAVEFCNVAFLFHTYRAALALAFALSYAEMLERLRICVFSLCPSFMGLPVVAGLLSSYQISNQNLNTHSYSYLHHAF